MREKGRWRRDVLGDPFWAYLCSVNIGSTLRLPYRGGFLTCQFSKVGTLSQNLFACVLPGEGWRQETLAQHLEAGREVAAIVFWGWAQGSSNNCSVCISSWVYWLQLVLWGTRVSLCPESHAVHLPDCWPHWPTVTAGSYRGNILLQGPQLPQLYKV